jgi:hypothetical protein
MTNLTMYKNTEFVNNQIYASEYIDKQLLVLELQKAVQDQLINFGIICAIIGLVFGFAMTYFYFKIKVKK